MAKKEKLDKVMIEVPLVEPEEIKGPVIMHIDGRLKQNHRTTLARLRTALEREHATLLDGRHVASVADAVRWLLEQVETAA